MAEEWLLGLEWGLGSLRAHWIAADGRRQRTDVDPAPLDPADLGAAQERLAALVRKGPGPVRHGVLCGMGAMLFEQDGPLTRVPCPATRQQITRALFSRQLGGINLLISPGLRCRTLFGGPDVLRGEEAPALGLAATTSDPRVLLSVPGRHGKWLIVEDGGIRTFHTAMTVEMHQLLSRYSIVGKGWSAERPSGPSFQTGVRQGVAGAGLLRELFALRGAVVGGIQTPADAGDQAWGLLIGSDIADALPALRQALGRVEVTIAGDPVVADMYRAALESQSIFATVTHADDLAAAGIWSVWMEAARGQLASTDR